MIKWLRGFPESKFWLKQKNSVKKKKKKNQTSELWFHFRRAYLPSFLHGTIFQSQNLNKRSLLDFCFVYFSEKRHVNSMVVWVFLMKLSMRMKALQLQLPCNGKWWQPFTKYLRLTLVSIGKRTLQEKFNFYFLRIYQLVFTKISFYEV